MLWVCVRQPVSGMFRVGVGRTVEFRPCATAEKLKACALIGFHMIAEEATSSSFSGLSPELRMWRNGGPRNRFGKA